MEQQLLERSTELEQQQLRVGARVGQGRPFPILADLMPPLLLPGHRTQPRSGAHPHPPRGRAAEVGHSREGAWLAGQSSLAMCPLVPLALPRSASLTQVNAMLREQLDQASSANQALREDIRKVTSDWSRSRKELEQREVAWRREEEVGTGGSLA